MKRYVNFFYYSFIIFCARNCRLKNNNNKKHSDDLAITRASSRGTLFETYYFFFDFDFLSIVFLRAVILKTIRKSEKKNSVLDCIKESQPKTQFVLEIYTECVTLRVKKKNGKPLESFYRMRRNFIVYFLFFKSLYRSNRTLILRSMYN